MQALGTVLIVVGSFIGSYLLVLDERAVDWPPFLMALAVGAVGVGLRRRGSRPVVVEGAKPHETLSGLLANLEEIAEAAAQLKQAAPALGVYALPGRIDADLRPKIATFVEDREEVAHALGLKVYAEVLSAFAAGERYMNRVWSASIDGYVDEAARSLERSCTHLDEALTLLRTAAERSPQSS